MNINVHIKSEKYKCIIKYCSEKQLQGKEVWIGRLEGELRSRLFLTIYTHFNINKCIYTEKLVSCLPK